MSVVAILRLATASRCRGKRGRDRLRDLAALLIVLLGLALVDSLNPSAIGVTVYLLLAEGRYVMRVLNYLSGVFVTYLGIGVLLLLGVTAVADKVVPVLARRDGISSGTLGGRAEEGACWAHRHLPPRWSSASWVHSR